MSWRAFREAYPNILPEEITSRVRDRVVYSERFQVTDRYDALGIPRPNPKTMCKGDCEGTGWVPVKADDQREEYRVRWQQAEKKEPSSDGWHFVQCPDCNGTGKMSESLRALTGALRAALHG